MLKNFLFLFFLSFAASALAYQEKDLARAKSGDKKLAGLDLSHADLRKLKLQKADLSGADLSYANLEDANLRGANLTGANLTGADLTSANLTGANLSNAELWKANLTDTRLRGAKLDDAELSGANLSNAILWRGKAETKNSKEDLLGQLEAEKKKLKDSTDKGNELERQLKETNEKLAQKEADLNSILEKLKDTTTDRDAKAKDLATSKDQLSTLQDQLKKTLEELETLRKQRAEIEKRLALFKDLTQKLQSMIDSGKLKVTIRNGQMIVELPAEVLFDSGKANLSAPGRETILQVAQTLQQLDRRFLIAGHTDNQPLLKTAKFNDNWELSTARAVTVTKTLIEGGMNPKNLSAAGYSEYDPIGDNSTDAGRQKNRRIEIVLLPNISELPQLPEK